MRQRYWAEVTYLFSHRIYRRVLRNPLRTAHGLWTEREGVIVRLEDAEGRVGFGEIAPIPDFGTESLEEAVAACRGLGDRIESSVFQQLPGRLGCVRFALSSAMTMAANAGAARVPVTALLPAGRAVLEALPARLEAGFLVFKWKVGVGDAADEMGVLDDLLARLPAYAKLRLDANGAWDRRVAAKWLDRCADRPVEFVEQPLAPEDRDGLMGLAQDFPVKLALDESVVRLESAAVWQQRGWPGLFVVKPALSGPLDELLAWVERTKADVVLSSAIETAVGRAAILRFALAHPVLLKRAVGFGVGELFGERDWDGPVMGPVLDTNWVNAVNPEAVWNALS